MRTVEQLEGYQDALTFLVYSSAMGGRFCLILVLGALVAAAVGCGGGGSTAGSAAADTHAAKEPEPYPLLKGPAREFILPKATPAAVSFGREASAPEREQANHVIHAWMRARAAKDFVVECRYFSKKYIKALVVKDAQIITRGRVRTCPGALAYFGPMASGDFANNLTGPIDSLRVGEGHGYALYHGRDGNDWFLGVDREDGKWWVAIAAPAKTEE
jgi:hypothetical protein